MKSLHDLRQIYKIETKRLKRNKWNLNLSYSDAQRLHEVIALGDSQLFRWIDKLSKAKKPKEAPLFQREIVAIVANTDGDFKKICKSGFYINGIKYKRLLGTTGGVKNNTVLFVEEILWEELNRRIDNGRNLQQELVPSKFEAYRALVASQSYPVSMPNGVIVVADAYTKFYDKVVYIDDSHGDRPLVEERDNYEVNLNANDGFGLCTPSLMERWSKEIKEDSLGGVCIRNAFTKGMIFAFDLIEFAEEVAHTYEITDVWGIKHDIRNVELVLTESMLKLNVGSYISIEDYLDNCKKNGYDFSICKIADNELDDERELNYQYLQSFNLSDEDVRELCEPTVKWLKDASCGDYESTLKFLGAWDREVGSGDLDYIEALASNPIMMKDPFVSLKVARLINKKIDDAKIGKLKVKGNYQIASGDPYTLAENMFGLQPKGILKSGEIYSSYWNSKDEEEVLIFRSPMTSHNNIRKGVLNKSELAKRWYRHMHNIIIMNSWDTSCMALNGCDYDSDSLFTTNNSVLMRNYIPMPAIECVQRKAEKKVVTEELLVQANLNGFGNEVGTVTNRITIMFDLLAQFDKDSEEYKELNYRILTGQLYQQNSIDKLKGILTTPMPKSWYSLRDCETEFDKRIVANKKPRFMTYIYETERREYKKFIDGHKEKSMIMFGVTLEELLNKENRTEEEELFVHYYNLRFPVTDNNCTMHKICRYVEQCFSTYLSEKRQTDFDKTLLQCKDVTYTTKEFNRVKKLYEEYKSESLSIKKANSLLRIDKSTDMMYRKLFKNKFLKQAKALCCDEMKLCNIVIDLCYDTKNSKQFAWDVCRTQMINNLKGSR